MTIIHVILRYINRQVDEMIKDLNFIFLLSSERSGSNLLNQIFNSHSLVCGPPPAHFFRLLLTNVQRYGNLENDENWAALLNDCHNYLKVKLGLWKTTTTASELIANIKNRTPLSILNYIYKKEAEFDGKGSVLIKENAFYDYASSVEQLLPNAKYLYLIRDPRAFFASYKHSPNHPLNINDAIGLWLKEQETYHDIVNKKDGPSARYEDLVSNPEQVLSHLFESVGLPFENSLLTHYSNNTTQENSKRIINWSKTGDKINNNRTSAFLSELTWNEVDYIQKECSAQMIKWNYKTIEKGDLHPYSQKTCLSPNIEETQLREARKTIIEQVLKRNLS